MSAVGEGPEQVVLLDETGRSVGLAAKAEVHGHDTPLHLAFSCYVADDAGRVLLTQRALSKPTWPGAWTNTVCGHPAPGEDLEDAVRRRARDELGLDLRDLRLLLPRFRYRAVMLDGTVENEMCPVLVARTADEPSPAPGEVEATTWVAWTTFREEVLAGRREISPWCAEQVAELPADPWTAPPADAGALPPVLRPD